MITAKIMVSMKVSQSPILLSRKQMQEHSHQHQIQWTQKSVEFLKAKPRKVQHKKNGERSYR